MLSLLPRSHPAAGQDAAAAAIVAAAISAYAAACPGLPFTTLTCEEARRHRSGDSLAEFLAIALTDGLSGATQPARFRHAADQVDYMIGSLLHVRERLIEHAASSGCLPLELDGGGDAPLAAHRRCA